MGRRRRRIREGGMVMEMGKMVCAERERERWEVLKRKWERVMGMERESWMKWGRVMQMQMRMEM